jgi:hypothetical protein
MPKMGLFPRRARTVSTMYGRSVGEEYSVGLQGQDLFRPGLGGNDQDLTAAAGQVANDVVLHPEIHGRHPVFLFHRGRDGLPPPPLPEPEPRSPYPLPSGLRPAPFVGLLAGNCLHPIASFHAGRSPGFFDQRRRGKIPGGEDPPHGSCRAKVLGQGPRVDPFDSHDSAAAQIIAQAALGPPVTRESAVLLHHEPLHMRMEGFQVFLIHPGISDQGVRHGHNLAFVGRIGENLLIAGHGGVEDHLPHVFPRGAKGPAFKYFSIFQG